MVNQDTNTPESTQESRAKKPILGAPAHKKSGKFSKDVGRDSYSNSTIDLEKLSQGDKQKQKQKVKDPIDLSTKTLKVSEPVLAKVQSLKPIIKDVEEIDRSTVNEVIGKVIDYYVENALNEKDRQRYQNVYDVFAP